MTLKNLLAEGRICSHKTSREEIKALFRVIERDFADAEIQQLSADRRFATAYSAALQLATVALYASGYRTTGKGHHWATFHVLPDIAGDAFRGQADYFDSCRRKRNLLDYDRAGEISASEAEEIIAEARVFREEILGWLKGHHGLLLSPEVEGHY